MKDAKNSISKQLAGFGFFTDHVAVVIYPNAIFILTNDTEKKEKKRKKKKLKQLLFSFGF